MMQGKYRALVVAAGLLAGTLLGGCSDDGGFFPGTINHNEGAVDYRIAPLDSSAYDVLRKNDPAISGNWSRLLPLGTDANSPYSRLGDAPALRSFWKIMPPQSVRGAIDKLNAATAAKVTAANDVLSAEQEVSDANDRLKAAEQEVRSAQAPFNSAKVAIEMFMKQPENVGYMPEATPPKEGTEERKRFDEYAFLSARLEEARVALDLAKSRSDSLTSMLRAKSEKLQTAQNVLDSQKAAEATARTEYDNAVASWRNPASTATDASSTSERVESIRVTLKQAYLRNFHETGPVGEVAVLMTVKESRSNLGQKEPRSGRVVYYSEGVRKNAFMNFRDQPVYGPIRYGGDDLQIRVSILELDDTDNKIAGSMLKSLATLGSIAYPPSSPVLSALDKIGESLLDLNGPDLEWDYLMRLSSRPPADPLGDTKWREGQVDAWLRDGYYVMLRSDTTSDSALRRRVSEPDWRSLYLDPFTGVLYIKRDTAAETLPCGDRDAAHHGCASAHAPSAPEPFEEYHDRSYLVFSLQSGFDSSQLDLAQEAAELNEIVNAYGGANPNLAGSSKAMADAIAQSIKDLKDRKEAEQKMRDIKK